MSGLTLGRGLTLPLDAVTETFVIVAKRGSGKTYTAKVLVEEMVDAGLPVCVIDPLGVWWGLRSSADGKSDGIPVVIFGGDHADVPLEESAGQLIADVVIGERISVVLDLSLLSKSAGRRFMLAFAERLQHRNRDALHLVVDEADMFAPQRPQADGARLLGAMEDLVRRGRARGIGSTLITQRPAVLNKDVLTQAEVLIALRMTGVRDVQAIDEWVKLHDVDDQAATVKSSLPSLPVGTAWVWSPGWLGILQKVAIRTARTFDSSATPKAGERRAVPKRMADVDLAALGERIAATVERAKADDPRELRRRITQMEKDLAERPTVEPERVEVPVLDEETRKLVERAIEQWDRAYDDAADAVNVLRDALTRVGDQHGRQDVPRTRPARRGPDPVGTGRRPQERPDPPARRDRGGAPVPRAPQAEGADAEGLTLGKTERNILTVLAQHGQVNHGTLALLSGYSPKASTIGVSMGKLRKAGLVEPGQPYRATQAGLDAMGGQVEPLPEGQALIDYWRHRFGATERNVLDAFLAVWPNDTSQAEVAERTGYSATASTIGVSLGKLRKVGVIDRWRISDDFAAAVGLR